jgi:hypothetical protein
MKVEAVNPRAHSASYFAIPTLWSHEDYDHFG